MENIKSPANRSYFAAANSYNGFVSLFNEIFNSRLFKHIYVIKGGPGTGKSSLMMKLLSSFSSEAYNTEAIYCSSDPSSLDGIIISKGAQRLALLDGTAPHERDAVIPGAIDEIINLGDGFDNRKLSCHREEILDLSSKKKEAYNKAYSLLEVAGNIWRQIYTISRESSHYSVAESIAERLSSCVSNDSFSAPEIIFSSAFNKLGLSKTDTLSNNNIKRIKLSGDGVTEHIVLGILNQKLQKRSSVITICPSPLDNSIYEKIITRDIIFEIDSQGADIDTKIIAKKKNDTLLELYHLHTRLLILSQGAFKEASDFHFKLEDIYKDAVDFRNNDRITKRLTGEIEGYLNS